jgi:membrane-associated phospholipid phosphatase
MRRSPADPRRDSAQMGMVDLVADDRGRAQRPVLIARPLWALAVVAVAVSIAGALGVRYAGESYPRWADELALMLAREWFPMPRGLARTIITLYDAVPLAIAIAVLVGACLFTGRRQLAVLAVAGPVLTGVATIAVKPLIERTKNGDLSYPSGHMGSAVAVAIVVALLLISLFGRRRWVIVLAAAVPVLWGATIGLAMTVTSYHYWTDAVGGFFVAVAVVLSLAVVIDSWPSRRSGMGRLPDWEGKSGALGRSSKGRDAPTT